MKYLELECEAGIIGPQRSECRSSNGLVVLGAGLRSNLLVCFDLTQTSQTEGSSVSFDSNEVVGIRAFKEVLLR